MPPECGGISLLSVRFLAQVVMTGYRAPALLVLAVNWIDNSG